MRAGNEAVQIKIPFSATSPVDLVLDRNSNKLIDKIYRTNQSIALACEQIGVEFSEEMMGDLEACTHCGVYWHSFELSPDTDDNNVCKFCETYYWN